MYETNNFNIMPQQNAMEMPMKWYKFLIYFSLFFSAILNVYNAIKMMTGKQYGSTFEAKAVYSVFPGLKPVDLIMGVLLISLAIACIVTRQMLKNFSKSGPNLLFTVFVFDLVIAISYIVIASFVTKISIFTLMDKTFIRTVLQSIVMISLNKVYFKKREHLFVN